MFNSRMTTVTSHLTHNELRCMRSSVYTPSSLTQSGCIARNATDVLLSVSVPVGNTCTHIAQLNVLAFAACGDSNTTSLIKPAMLPAGVVTMTAPMDAFGMLRTNNASLKCDAHQNALVGGGALGEGMFVAAGGRVSSCRENEAWASATCQASGAGTYEMCASTWGVTTCRDPIPNGCTPPGNIATPFTAQPCQQIFSGLRVLGSWCTYQVRRSAAASLYFSTSVHVFTVVGALIAFSLA